TNITSDHLDYHGSLANYRQVKRRMLDALAPDGLAIINSDDPICRSWLADIERPTLTIGMRSSADVSARLLEAHRSEQSFVITAGSESIAVRTAMIGEHHIYNCLIATAAGLSMNIDLATIARGLENITAMPGRLERIECGQPFGVFVDYAHTPDALQRSLSTLRQVTEGRLICVYGAGGDRDRKKRPEMGRVVEQFTDAGIITNDNPRREPPEQIIEEILAGYFRPEQAIIEPDRASAIGAALNAAEPGDCVLIAGKGHETIQEIGEHRIDFDDRDVARGWLYAAESVDAMIGQSRRRN
ncbi:MAG: UDP-N-acetylmuramoyl-L-alanyl-D-glutamate--2,6-diaminopimelate ligase, partial [Pirellulales bacterium]